MKNDKIKNQYRVNEQIHVREVRVVGDKIASTVMPTNQALAMAQRECQSASVQVDRLLQVSLSAEEACQGNEGQAGQDRSQGDPLRTADR